MNSLKVLVADDSQSVRVHLQHLLNQNGYRVEMAADGVAAVELIEQDPPDVAILDIKMPRLDGYGVCESIRASGFDFPIVFLTSIQANAVKMLGDEMGAYLQKPVQGDDLLRTIRRMVNASPEFSTAP